jgi:hypothetical protein
LGRTEVPTSPVGRRGFTCSSKFRNWHFSAVPTAPSNVRFQGRDELLNIEIRVSSDHSTTLADDLQRGKLDIAFLRPEQKA